MIEAIALIGGAIALHVGAAKVAGVKPFQFYPEAMPPTGDQLPVPRTRVIARDPKPQQPERPKQTITLTRVITRDAEIQTITITREG